MFQPPSIQQLRTRVGRITGIPRQMRPPHLATGISAIDILLFGGLSRGAIHEVVGDQGACTGFLTALLGQERAIQQVIWIGMAGDLYTPGLHQLGLGHRRLTIASARRADDRLWMAEESLKDLPQGAVVAEVERPNLTETRRLQLSAEAAGSIGFLMRRDRQPSAAVTRWLIEPARSTACQPTWKVTLERAKGSEAAGSWVLQYDSASLHLDLASSLLHRQAEAAA